MGLITFDISASVKGFADFITKNKNFFFQDKIEKSKYIFCVAETHVEIKVGSKCISLFWTDKQISSEPSEILLKLQERPNEYLCIYKALKGVTNGLQQHTHPQPL